MTLLRTMLIWVGVSCVIWIALTWLPVVLRLLAGRATGAGIIVPRVLRVFPKALQVPLALSGIPLIAGSIGACLWHFLKHR